jgi:hypothetical protein
VVLSRIWPLLRVCSTILIVRPGLVSRFSVLPIRAGVVVLTVMRLVVVPVVVVLVGLVRRRDRRAARWHDFGEVICARALQHSTAQHTQQQHIAMSFEKLKQPRPCAKARHSSVAQHSTS